MAGHGPPTKKKNATADEDDDEILPPAPDGGWGWVVVFASFMIHVVNDGITYSFGVFYNEFVDYFQEGQGKTAWIASILVGVTLCSGPISSMMVNRWGCRTVTIIGAVLGTLGMIASVWAPNVVTLYFTVGLGTGLGFGLIYLPAIVCVTIYFEKRRSLATGIAVCGSGFGTVVFAPIINTLIREYGWRGAMLISSSAVLECIIFGALFRPLTYPKKKPKVEESLGMSDCYGSGDCKALSVSQGKLAENGNISFQSQNEESAKSQPLLAQSNHSIISGVSRTSARSRGSLRRPDVFYQRSLQNIPIHVSRRSLAESYSVKRRYPEDDEKEETICGCIPCGPDTKGVFMEMLNFSVMRDPLFLIFLTSNFLTSIGCNIPYVFCVPRAIEMGIDESVASYLLSTIGIANAIGRIVLGYISDKAWVNRLYVYIYCLIICGLGVIAAAMSSNFYIIAVGLAVFGFTFGAYVGLTSVLLVDLLGLEKLTNAFGVVLLFQGVASLVGPPIAGTMIDVMGLYEPAFYLSGITIALSGAILFAVPPIQKHLESKAVNDISHPDI